VRFLADVSVRREEALEAVGIGEPRLCCFEGMLELVRDQGREPYIRRVVSNLDAKEPIPAGRDDLVEEARFAPSEVARFCDDQHDRAMRRKSIEQCAERRRRAKPQVDGVLKANALRPQRRRRRCLAGD
jgi:hypothetical protein